MKRIQVGRVVGLVVATVLVGVATLFGGGVAGAVITDGYASVRQVVCTDIGRVVDLTYTNSYGNTSTRSSVTLRGKAIGGGRTCISLDTSTGEYGGFVGTHISSDSGGYVYCAIYVNGRKVAQSDDDSEYFSFAMC
ncbi:hypothetical protein [Williamsia sp. CHRR-6]|uniref:hypothetical protein n=1 Tax=Williamsia sp. CHRR-6 TaxID=2835871 RepID=UPI001BDA16C5|nr:hypothetical protein [Williamsia sp. CHRR-6]MBT0567414.1 hypothetical protein [Williamsia sp. CHRR-6]